MGLQEIRDLADKLTARLAEVPDEVAFQQAGRLAHLLDELDLESDLPAGPGFVCLPIGAHDRLRAAAERAEEAEARLLACEQSLLVQLDEKGLLDMRLRDARATIKRLTAERPDPTRFPINPEPGREGDRIEPFTPGPMHVTPRTTPDPVVHQHLRDLQGEVDGLKDRLEEGCRQHQGLNARLAALEDVGGFPVGGEFAEFKRRLDEQSDRLHAFGARMNKAEAQMKPRPVETSVTPFTNAPA